MNTQGIGYKVRFRNRGKKYIAEFCSDKFISEKSPLIAGIAMFRIYDERQSKMLGAISFTETLLLNSIWAEGEIPQTHRITALVNLLHYLPLDIDKIISIYPRCFEYRFARDSNYGKNEDNLLIIKGEDHYKETFQKIIFNGQITNKKIQEAALEIMFNHWEDNPDTNVPVELLKVIIPVDGVDLIRNLKLLLAEKKIRAVTSPSNKTILISVGLEPQMIRELDGDIEPMIKYPQMVKQVFGTNIENLSTLGDNSPINITVGDIDTAFGGITKQIENKKFEGKEEIIPLLKQLQKELKDDKNPSKIKNLLDNIKSKAVWVYNLIINNPILTAYLTQLLLKNID